jgi:hypothetical protein
LIVSELRSADRDSASKARKDLEQASVMIEALANSSSRLDLGLACIEARDRGPKWHEALEGRKASFRRKSRSGSKQLAQMRVPLMISSGDNNDKSSASRPSAISAVGTRQGDFIADCSPLAIAQQNDRKTKRS